MSIHEKKTFRKQSSSSGYGGSKIQEISQHPHKCWIPTHISVLRRKMVLTFCKVFLQFILDINTYSTIKKNLKLKALLRQM
jgi:hypothetical protein